MNKERNLNLWRAIKNGIYYRNNPYDWEKTIPRISESSLPHTNCIEGGLNTGQKLKQTNQSKHPLVSIITIVYNGDKHLEQTIQSVLNQTYDNIEYIIIDGGSTDKSIDIIRKYENKISYWISEPDNGISDAFNKGIQICNGEIIGLINSDDWYKSTAVELSVKSLNDRRNYDFSFGGLELYKENVYSHSMCCDENYPNSIKYNIPAINHPTLFVKRSAYARCGLFTTQLRYSMDYELFFRMYTKKIKGVCLKENIACMRIVGTSYKASTIPLLEVLQCSIMYGQSVPLSIILYLIRVLKGKIRRLMESMGLERELHILRKTIERNYE